MSRNSTPWMVSFAVMCTYAASADSCQPARGGMPRQPSASPLAAMFTDTYGLACLIAVLPQYPLPTYLAACPAAARFIGCNALRVVAPPERNRTAQSSGHDRRVNRSSTACSAPDQKHKPQE